MMEVRISVLIMLIATMCHYRENQCLLKLVNISFYLLWDIISMVNYIILE